MAGPLVVRPGGFGDFAMQENAIADALLTMRLLRSKKQFCVCERNIDAFDRDNLDRLTRFGVVDPARTDHQIDQNFIRYAHNRVGAKVVVSEFENCLVRQNFQSLLDSNLVLWIAINQKIDVFGRAQIPVMNYRETTDDHIPRPVFVQRATNR